MGLGLHLAEVLRPVVDLAYPPRCPLCGGAIADQGGLCGECWGALEVPGESACTRCARPMDFARSTSLRECGKCRADRPRHAGVYAATLYNDASRKLVLAFKHGGKIGLARLLGRMIAVRLPPVSPDNPPLLVPVPLHRWRLWARGYNQSALLAQVLAQVGKGELLVDALVRRKRTPSLGGLGNEERRKVLRGAIVVRGSRKAAIAGRDVILVDDVLTSGATSNACVAALLDAGAVSVWIACFARVGGASGAMTSSAPETTTPGAMTAPGAA
jgi:ComF family protein